MKNFLFIAGCARSGTSALAQLVSSSDKVLMAMERFGHLTEPKNFQLKKEHFEKERFYKLEPGDTFYQDLESFHKYDPEFFTKYEKANWIGDKRPDLYESYDKLFGEFPQCKVIFIYRNVIDVASSYHGRIKEGKNWPASKDFEAAVREWNRSLFLTSEAIKKGYDISVVTYEDIFCSTKNLAPIFEALNIETDETINSRIQGLRKRSQQLADQRELLLSDHEVNFIDQNAKRFLTKNLQTNLLIR